MPVGWGYSDMKYTMILVGTIVALTAIIHFLRRRKPHGLTMEERNLLATNFGFFTTLYTFFLGLAVVTLLTSFNDADTANRNEPQAIGNMFRAAKLVPDSNKFRAALIQYTKSVIENEFPKWDKGEYCEKTEAAKSALWDTLLALKPANLLDQPYHLQLMAMLVDWGKLRGVRLAQVDGNLYGPIWILIHLGLLFSVLGFYFLDVDNKKGQVFFMVTMLTMITLNIFLIYELDKPFSGWLCLDSTPFKSALEQMLAAK